MATINTSDLIGPALDWSVAQCELMSEYSAERGLLVHRIGYGLPMPAYSTDGSLAVPIIEREKICVSWTYPRRMTDPPIQAVAQYFEPPHSAGNKHREFGHSLWIAAMRCYVAAKLGDTVDVPDSIATIKEQA